MKFKWSVLAGVGLFAAAWMAAGDAQATLEQQKIFKGAFPGKEKYACTICHVAKLPKKDSHALNDYGNKALEAAGGEGKKPSADNYKSIGDPDAAK